MAEGSHPSSTLQPSRPRFAGFLLIVVIATLALIVLWVKHPAHRLRLRACFRNVNGLRAGAPVRISGVEVGMVRAVRAQPTNSNCPADIEIDIATDYTISLPSDAVASIETAGVLGESFVEIDATHASGTPLANGQQIQGREEDRAGAAGLNRIIESFLNNAKDKTDSQRNDAPCAPTPSAKTSVPKATSH